MKKLIPVLLVVVLAACGKNEWSKKYVYDDCMKEMTKNEQAAKMFSKEKMEKICDCSAGKTVDKFKSESDAKNNTDGLKEIGKECAMEVLAK